MPLYAHSRPGAAPEFWELLADHAAAVAGRAGRNADAFDAASLAQIAGWLHDLGKATPGFQRKLTGEANQASHSGEGARYAMENLGPVGKIIAYVIAGHHSGVPNGEKTSDHCPPTPLLDRLDQAEALGLPDGLTPPAPALPALINTIPKGSLFPIQFFTRMLSSALVDADFVETERFYTPDAPRRHAPDLTACAMP